MFERLGQGKLNEFDDATLEALRYAFRYAWAKGDYEAIVRAGNNLPEEILDKEPLLVAYLSASRQQLSTN